MPHMPPFYVTCVNRKAWDIASHCAMCLEENDGVGCFSSSTPIKKIIGDDLAAAAAACGRVIMEISSKTGAYCLPTQCMMFCAKRADICPILAATHHSTELRGCVSLLLAWRENNNLVVGGVTFGLWRHRWAVAPNRQMFVTVGKVDLSLCLNFIFFYRLSSIKFFIQK